MSIRHPWLYRQKHLISARDFDRASLEMIFLTTKVMKTIYLEDSGNDEFDACLVDDYGRPLRFRLLFWGDSTRTEGSFEDAIESLGGVPKTKRMEFSGAAKGESHWSITRILGPRCHGFIVRDDNPIGKTAVPRMADAIEAYGLTNALINAGNGNLEHPTQMLTDFYTIWEERQHEFENGSLTFGLVGDLWGSRTIHSFIVGLHHFGGTIILVGPHEYDLPPEFYELAATYPKIAVRRVIDLTPVISEVDVWYFTRLQSNLRGEKLSPEIEYWYARTYGVNDAFRASAKQDALVLHPLPHGPEYPDEQSEASIDLVDPRFIHFQQADNGFHIRRALLALMYVPDFYTTHILKYADVSS